MQAKVARPGADIDKGVERRAVYDVWLFVMEMSWSARKTLTPRGGGEKMTFA
jgi:hypothetical protein